VRGAALQELISHPAVSAERIEITIANGWLTLKGEVRRQDESNAAFDAVSRLPGVVGITNESR
jgi:osmotically-inducible protein OsmY